MRIVLSRKGFDSSSGGCPSPVFEDGSMFALPIPDRTSPVRYRDLEWRGRNVGELASALTRGKVRPDWFAHLDPDLRPGTCARDPGWRPAFGQHDGQQTHLRNQGVREGDLFLYWGLFRRVDAELRRAGPDVHALWGWLQIGEVANVDATVRERLRRREWRWAARHPHLAPERVPDPTNTLYLASDDLELPGLSVMRGRGSGVFDTFSPALQLTASSARGASLWQLPAWFAPDGRPPLSHHADPKRWTRSGDHVLLQAVARGQEFVLDADAYPEAVGWVADLVVKHG